MYSGESAYYNKKLLCLCYTKNHPVWSRLEYTCSAGGGERVNDMIEVKDNVIDIGEELGVMELNPEPVEAMNILHIWTDFDSMDIKKDMVEIDAGIENCVDDTVTAKVNLRVTLLEGGRYLLNLYEGGGASSCLERILANGTDITEQVVDVVRQHFSWWIQRYVKRFVCEGTRMYKWYEEVK